MTHQATLTSGLTFWVPVELRARIDELAVIRGVSLGTVAREFLNAGVLRIRPRHLRAVPKGEVQISFMVSPGTRVVLDAMRRAHGLTLSEAARVALQAGREWKARPQ